MHSVITGTGRCGTRYTAALLSGAGIRATHEDVYRPYGKQLWGGTKIDVSFFAGFWTPIEEPLAHQVRDPLKVISSWTRTGINSPRAEVHAHILRVTGDLPCRNGGSFEDRIESMTIFWLKWTAHLDNHTDIRWRVEDLPNQALADFTGVDLAALKAVELSTSLNSRETPERVTADDIPDHLWPEFQERAATYGYPIERQT